MGNKKAKKIINFLLSNYLLDVFVEVTEESRMATLTLLLAIHAVLNLIAFKIKKMVIDKYKILNSLILDINYTYNISISQLKLKSL